MKKKLMSIICITALSLRTLTVSAGSVTKDGADVFRIAWEYSASVDGGDGYMIYGYNTDWINDPADWSGCIYIQRCNGT